MRAAIRAVNRSDESCAGSSADASPTANRFASSAEQNLETYSRQLPVGFKPTLHEDIYRSIIEEHIDSPATLLSLSCLNHSFYQIAGPVLQQKLQTRQKRINAAEDAIQALVSESHHQYFLHKEVNLQRNAGVHGPLRQPHKEYLEVARASVKQNAHLLTKFDLFSLFCVSEASGFRTDRSYLPGETNSTLLTLRWIFEHSKNLQHLSFKTRPDCALYLFFEAPLALPKLRTLDLSNVNVPHGFFRASSENGIESLQSLTCRSNGRIDAFVNDDFWGFVSAQKNLRYLNINLRSSEENVAAFVAKGHSSLQTIILGNQTKIYFRNWEPGLEICAMRDLFRPALLNKKFPQLQRLEIQRVRLSRDTENWVLSSMKFIACNVELSLLAVKTFARDLAVVR